jgi:predicted nucleic acid-binding protein
VNVVDSSGWLEFFAGSERAALFEPAILEVDALIVPTLSLFEVYKVVLRQRSETEALQAVTFMRQGEIVDLDGPLALSAAEHSVRHRLPMADSILLATARSRDAALWTQDRDFAGIDGVRYFSK